ncbi:hypothetical protein RND71_014311 [Anisodus tanguticus]|uniref:Uncharacterized protein n=1 Tax=Anisodus tanguticus TaxID=243964 RepID=A0AAE1VJT5_9SOLA|nr:hypothetical protein RND71_014311 [Anisodus tanguticus]
MQDQKVYARFGISKAKNLFVHVFIANGLHVAEGGQLEECSAVLKMLSRTRIKGIMTNVVFVSFEELKKELMFVLTVLQAYLGYQKHCNKFEAVINDLLNEHNVLCVYNEMFSLGYHKVNKANPEVLNLQEIACALGEWKTYVEPYQRLHELVREVMVGKMPYFHQQQFPLHNSSPHPAAIASMMAHRRQVAAALSFAPVGPIPASYQPSPPVSRAASLSINAFS